MAATFDQAFIELMRHEGGYSEHESDPGGKTRYGITEAVARQVGYRGDMRDLPIDLAKRIYLEQYWKPIKAEMLPSGIRYAVFDAAVNSGVGQSIRWVQRVVGVKDDGVIGPITLKAIDNADPDVLLRGILAERLRFMTHLPAWNVFSRGWARRIADVMEV
jgi:lysozyme family protein